MTLLHLALFSAALGLTTPGWGDSIIDTFGPGNSFLPPPGVTIGGGILRNDPLPDAGVTQAFEFVPHGPVLLTSVDLGLQYFLIPGKATGPANLDVSIAMDNAGTPGSPLETVHLTNVLGSAPFMPGIVSTNFALNPLLQAGTPYWLVVAPPDLLNTAFDWLISPRTDLTVLEADRLGKAPWGGGETTQPLAFRVSGVAAIPEPRPALLAIFGVLVLASVLRRRTEGDERVIGDSPPM